MEKCIRHKNKRRISGTILIVLGLTTIGLISGCQQGESKDKGSSIRKSSETSTSKLISEGTESDVSSSSVVDANDSYDNFDSDSNANASTLIVEQRMKHYMMIMKR